MRLLFSRGLLGLYLLAADGAGLGAGCADSSVVPTIMTVEPGQAYNDGVVRLTIETLGVRPVLDVDIGHARLATSIASIFQLLPEMEIKTEKVVVKVPANLTSVEWLAENAFAADAHPHLPLGTYALEVINPDGRSGTSPHAFTSLGPDVFPPIVAGLDPPDGSALHAGETITASIAVDDGFGQVSTPIWTIVYKPLRMVTSQVCALGQGPTIPGEEQRWLATFTVPVPPDGEPTASFHFSVSVRDGGGNSGHLDADFIAVRKPAIVELAPTRGGTGGGQTFMLRGTSFLPGARVWFGVEEAIEATVLDADPALGGAVGAVIVGLVPPHARAETVGVSVETPGGRTTARDGFVYLAPPRIRGIEPAVGPGRGGIRVTVKGSDFREHTKVFMGTGPADKRELLDCLTVLPPDKATGALVPGVGTVKVWAEDPDTGSGFGSPATFPFTFLADGASAGASPSPAGPDCASITP